MLAFLWQCLLEARKRTMVTNALSTQLPRGESATPQIAPVAFSAVQVLCTSTRWLSCLAFNPCLSSPPYHQQFNFIRAHLKRLTGWHHRSVSLCDQHHKVEQPAMLAVCKEPIELCCGCCFVSMLCTAAPILARCWPQSNQIQRLHHPENHVAWQLWPKPFQQSIVNLKISIIRANYLALSQKKLHKTLDVEESPLIAAGQLKIVHAVATTDGRETKKQKKRR